MRRGFVTWRSLSPSDTAILKGIAMLVVMLHNFFHLVPPVVGENEFDFAPHRLPAALSAALGQPLAAPQIVFSPFGIYSLQIFIFLSAYGLACSKRNASLGFSAFLRERLSKLYPAFILSVMMFLVLKFYAFHSDLETGAFWKSLALKLALVANFFPGEGLALCGPWWFYSFIFQLYLIFPWLLRCERAFPRATLAATVVGGSVLGAFFQGYWFHQTNTSLYLQVLGHLPEIGLGLTLARRESLRISWVVLLVAAGGLVWGNLHAWAWPFTFLWATVLVLGGMPVFLAWVAVHPKGRTVFLELGRLSMYLFASHGFLRAPFVALAARLSHPLATFSIAVAFVLTALVVALCLRFLEEGMRSLALRERAAGQGSNGEEKGSKKPRTLGSLT